MFELASQPKQRIFAAGGAILACCQLWQHPMLRPLYTIAAKEVLKSCPSVDLQRQGGYSETIRKLRIGRSPQVLANVMSFAAEGQAERSAARPGMSLLEGLGEARGQQALVTEGRSLEDREAILRLCRIGPQRYRQTLKLA